MQQKKHVAPARGEVAETALTSDLRGIPTVAGCHIIQSRLVLARNSKQTSNTTSAVTF